MFNFTPDPNQKEDDLFAAPFLEDARTNFAPYYSSDKTEKAARDEVVAELVKLGASRVKFQSGRFLIGATERHGYNIRYLRHGSEGLIRVAGLPIRKPNQDKIDQVRVQALLNVRDWIKSAVTSRVFSPGSDILLQFTLADPAKNITVGDLMRSFLQTGQFPQLPPPGEDETDETFEGEFRET